jgi:Tol biopolymer transport system component
MFRTRLIISCFGFCLVFGCSEPSGPSGFSDTYKLAYDGPDLRIHITNADGTGKELLGTFPATAPAFSPKGVFLAMITNTFRQGPGGDSLVLLDLSTSKRKDLAFLSSDSLHEVHEYAWSPDGTKIAFVRTVQFNVREDLYVVDILTGELLQLTDQYRSHLPSWSSDSRTVFFERIGRLPYPYGEYLLVDSDGKNLRTSPYQVPGRQGGGVRWNPNGQTVALEGWEVSGQSAGTYILDVYTMSVEGSNLRQLTSDGGSFHPNWSPDGRKIAFVSSNVSNGYNLFVVNGDGSEKRAITSHSNVYPYQLHLWSSDGKKIAYTYIESGQAGVPHLHVVDIDDLIDTDTGVSNFLSFDWKPF